MLVNHNIIDNLCEDAGEHKKHKNTEMKIEFTLKK